MAIDFQHKNSLGVYNQQRFKQIADVLWAQSVCHGAHHFIIECWLSTIGIRNPAAPISSYIAMRLLKQRAYEYKQTFIPEWKNTP